MATSEFHKMQVYDMLAKAKESLTKHIAGLVPTTKSVNIGSWWKPKYITEDCSHEEIQSSFEYYMGCWPYYIFNKKLQSVEWLCEATNSSYLEISDEDMYIFMLCINEKWRDYK